MINFNTINSVKPSCWWIIKGYFHYRHSKLRAPLLGAIVLLHSWGALLQLVSASSPMGDVAASRGAQTQLSDQTPLQIFTVFLYSLFSHQTPGIIRKTSGVKPILCGALVGCWLWSQRKWLWHLFSRENARRITLVFKQSQCIRCTFIVLDVLSSHVSSG